MLQHLLVYVFSFLTFELAEVAFEQEVFVHLFWMISKLYVMWYLLSIWNQLVFLNSEEYFEHVQFQIIKHSFLKPKCMKDYLMHQLNMEAFMPHQYFKIQLAL